MRLKDKKAVVIGAGLGGLSSAALLAKEGANVTLIEKNEQTGGRASIYEEKGYKFDMGPSWYLMTEVFEKFFGIFGKQSSDFYETVRLTPSYRVFTEDNQTIDIPDNLLDLYDLFDELEPNGGEKLKAYLIESEAKYKISLDSFVYKSYRSPADFFNLEMLKKSRKLNVFNNLQDYVESNFESLLARKILQYTIVFLGASPKNSPALYSLLSHADLNQGVFYPIGGIKEIANAIETICKEHNVEIKLNEAVKRINVENKQANMVVTDKNEYEADIVVANADYQFVETKLLDEKSRSISQKQWDKKLMAPSGFILYLGINRPLEKLAHHSFVWKDDWSEHFKTMFNTYELPRNASFYMCCPSRTDKTIAPENSEALFILVPSAVDVEDTAETRAKLHDTVIKEFEEYTGEKISENIQVEKSFFINDFKSRYNAFKGTGLGLAHTLKQSAIFRPKNFSNKVENLYYSGQYTNPGTGMPMVIISSQIVLDEVVKKHSTK